MVAEDPSLKLAMATEPVQYMEQDGRWRSEVMLPGFQDEYDIQPRCVCNGEVVTWNVKTPEPLQESCTGFKEIAVRSGDIANHINVMMEVGGYLKTIGRGTRSFL